jgi:hypothetical protein
VYPLDLVSSAFEYLDVYELAVSDLVAPYLEAEEYDELLLSRSLDGREDAPVEYFEEYEDVERPAPAEPEPRRDEYDEPL